MMVREGIMLYDKQLAYDDFKRFMYDNWNTIFRYWIYRRQYTPYEQDQKFTDESVFEDIFCKQAYIRQCIFLPDDDILIGFVNVDANSYDDKNIQYCKLSEIRLESCSADQDDEEEDECEDNECDENI